MLNYQFHSDASTVMWPQTTQGHGQQQPSLSVVTTVWGVTSSMTNGTANMTHDPSNPGIPTTNTVNSVGHPYLSTSANPKPYAQQGKLSVFFFFLIPQVLVFASTSATWLTSGICGSVPERMSSHY